MPSLMFVHPAILKDLRQMDTQTTDKTGLYTLDLRNICPEAKKIEPKPNFYMSFER